MRFTRTKVVIINGEPGAGKDSFAKLVQSYCNMNEYANILNLSSVDPIKDMLTGFGWDGYKSDDVRNIIAGIKRIWIGAQNGPTMFMMNNILEWHKDNIGEDNIVFCHIREPEEIEKLVNALHGMDTMGIDVTTMLVVRGTVDSSDICSGRSYVRDSDNPNIISQYKYDNIIYNDSDLAGLDEKACMFVNKLFEED